MKALTLSWTSQVQVLKNLEETSTDKNYANHKHYNAPNSEDFPLILMSQDPKLNKRLDLRGQSIQVFSFKTLRKVIFKLQIRPSFILLNHRKINPQIERAFITLYTPITLITLRALTNLI